MADYLIEFKIQGQDIRPNNLRLKDLGDFLAYVEDAIAPLVIKSNPKLSREEIIIGLVGIRPGSIDLDFSPQLPEFVLPAVYQVAEAISSGNFENLPPHSVESIRKITSFCRKQRCSIEVIAKNGSDETLATITPELAIRPSSYIVGQTVIYGYVLRVGGAEPKVLLRLTGNNLLSCDGLFDTVKKLAPRLYTWVGLEGTAKWNPKNFSIEEFKIERILDYEEGKVYEAVNEISNLIEPFYRDVPDPDRYIADLRGDDLED